MGMTIKELAGHLGAEVLGLPDGADREITGIGPLDAAGAGDVTFVADARREAAALDCKAAAVIVARPIEDLDKMQLVVADVNAALIRTLEIFAPKLVPPAPGVHPSAQVAASAQLGDGASIGPRVIIADDVTIGAGTIISGGCVIDQNVRIGAHCRLDPNVVVYHHCLIGNHVIVQANSTIGSIGFGYAAVDGAPRLIPHNGGVIIEDFVEIGANTCVDRAKFGNTMIGAGTKIDNLVQVAHNVIIGKCCLIAAQVGVAGSCRLGDGVVLGGQVGLADNVSIGDGTMAGGKAGIVNDIEPGRKIAWAPAIDAREAARVVAHALRLPKMSQELKRLTARVEELEAAEDNKGRGETRR